MELSTLYASEEEAWKDDSYLEDLNPFRYGIQPNPRSGEVTDTQPVSVEERFKPLYDQLRQELKAELAQTTHELELRAKSYEERSRTMKNGPTSTHTIEDDQISTETTNSMSPTDTETDKEKAKALRALIALLNKHEHTFAVNPRAPPATGVMEHTINLVRPEEPLGKSPPRYRRSDTDRAFIEEWVAWMKEFGLVEEAPDATFAMNLNIVKKGDKWRVCIDPRVINAKTTNDPFPSLTIDEIFQSLKGSIVFSGLDAAAGYWQIPIKKEDGKYTAFRVDDAVYRYIVMPFGLKNAPATFNR